MESPAPPKRQLSRVEKAELQTYSAAVCTVFAMNTLLGSGPLALPYGFWECGMFLATGFLLIFVVLAYATCTYLIESIVIANVLLKMRGDMGPVPVFEVETKGDKKIYRATDPKVWDISRRIEYGQLAEVFFGPLGVKVTYLCLIVYTMGVLAVFSVAVPQALQTLLTHDVLGIRPYYIFLIAFCVCALPFCFGNFQGTRVLQIICLFLRVLVFACMLFATIYRMSTGQGLTLETEVADGVQVTGLPWMMGNAICTFMFHHSVPGMVKPVAPQSSIKKAMFSAISLSLVGYIILCTTAVFAFAQVKGLYTLNFIHFRFKEVAVFLQVYPTLLVALFPIICITLRNNILNAVTLFRSTTGEFTGLAPQPVKSAKKKPALSVGDLDDRLLPAGGIAADGTVVPLEAEAGPLSPARAAPAKAELPSFKKQAAYTVLAILPAVVIASLTDHIQGVRSVTGAFPGIMVMFLIPTALAYRARHALLVRVTKSVEARLGILSPRFRSEVDPSAVVVNPQASPFKSKAWMVAIVLVGLASATYDAVDIVVKLAS